MKAKSIPEDIKEEVETIIRRFNKKSFKKNNCYYKARFKGKCDDDKLGPICRLAYNGKMLRQ